MSTLRQASLALAGVGAGLVLIGTACSPSGAAANNQTASTPAPHSTSRGPVMASKPCQNDNLHRAKCMIELILADVERSHGGIDGGGISQIKAVSSTSYAVSLPLEERVETITYEFEVQDGSVSLKSKSTATKTYGG